MPDSTYHMTEYQQWSTLLIAVLLVYCAGLGIKAIVRDILNRDALEELFAEIDEYNEDMFLGRDQHNKLHLEGWSD